MSAQSRTIPLLPCRALDDVIPFYEALGFQLTYRQNRPNPYAVVELGDIAIHLFGMDAFAPADSYGSVIILVADPDELYESWAAGLRSAFGKLPTAGIPRIIRPRKKQGVVYGFTVVDPGGNWLRIGQLSPLADEQPSTGLSRVIDNAARLGDSHGDEVGAIRLLTNGLDRFVDAPAFDRARAFIFRAELAARTGERALGTDSLAAALDIDLEPDERSRLADELAHGQQLLDADDLLSRP